VFCCLVDRLSYSELSGTAKNFHLKTYPALLHIMDMHKLMALRLPDGEMDLHFLVAEPTIDKWLCGTPDKGSLCLPTGMLRSDF